MAILSDNHLHSSFSGDSDTPMEHMIAKGMELGLSSMCFTEHMDMDFVGSSLEELSSPEELANFEVDTDAFQDGLLYCQEKYRDKIKINFGIELGIQPHISERLSEYAGKYDFDFIIGSSHICNRKDPYFPTFYENRSEEEAYREYFTSILTSINSFHDFDIYGHLDYVVRYGPNKDAKYTYDKYKDILDKILITLIDMGKGIEVNTGAINYKLKELNPCTDVIKQYKKLGGEIITVGSDAHRPDAICNGFKRAEEVLLSAGFEYYTTFNKRKAEYHKLK